MKTMERKGPKCTRPRDRAANAQREGLRPLQVRPTAAESGAPGGSNGMLRRPPRTLAREEPRRTRQALQATIPGLRQGSSRKEGRAYLRRGCVLTPPDRQLACCHPGNRYQPKSREATRPILQGKDDAKHPGRESERYHTWPVPEVRQYQVE